MLATLADTTFIPHSLPFFVSCNSGADGLFDTSLAPCTRIKCGWLGCAVQYKFKRVVSKLNAITVSNSSTGLLNGQPSHASLSPTPLVLGLAFRLALFEGHAFDFAGCDVQNAVNAIEVGCVRLPARKLPLRRPNGDHLGVGSLRHSMWWALVTTTESMAATIILRVISIPAWRTITIAIARRVVK